MFDIRDLEELLGQKLVFFLAIELGQTRNQREKKKRDFILYLERKKKKAKEEEGTRPRRGKPREKKES